jgi:hypothetical protein
MKRRLISNLLGLVGAAIGGVLGFYSFGWLYDHGFYGMVIPGAFVGLGCGLLAQHRSMARGIVCGVAGLCASLFAEWWYNARFVPDNTFWNMARNIHHEGPVTLLMMAIGTIVAFWFGQDAGFGLAPWSRSYRPPAAKPDRPGGDVQ